MIHPKTELKFINDVVGYGVFATQLIPEGTIVYVKDSLELVIAPNEYRQHNHEMREVIDKYSYIDESGNRIVSWDFAKYVNHCCNCNSISTGYGFEIAIRDIHPGEQITDEYGIFNIDQEMELVCGESCCRKKIALDDFDKHYEAWDAKIKKSIAQLPQVAQPLMGFVNEETREELDRYFANADQYKSVYALKYHGDLYVEQDRTPIATLPLDNHMAPSAMAR
ncbi:SET domain-containing protein-lysine N-methyltransferase [Reichenbachiella sp. 5M10]|uniref:SET domain-containing protein n=1 Tax=Reichenbachiella sp. 5M10 TaxID=1889772 RepID=UPI000C1599F0|nr:SET domain-containing protein [Reichenbachiella sp. 5M10]PIB35981.1 SET domain-containing protein-lysine N-methyltransferase [Reichenbachiella sp. 5M10]